MEKQLIGKQGKTMNPYFKIEERMIAVAETILHDGPMGDTLRGNIYRDFVRCGFPLATCMANGGDIGKIKTSCGVFAGAVLHHSGFERKTKPSWGKGFIGNWIHLTYSHPCFEKNPTELGLGDIFYIGDLHGTNGHVGVVLGIDGSKIKTAEGGGGDGTRCRIGERTLGKDFDKYRKLTGRFRISMLNDVATEGTDQFLCLERFREIYG